MTAVGYATLTIIPSALGFGKALTEQVAPELALSGAVAGKALGEGVATTAATGAAKGAKAFTDFGKVAALGLLGAGIASAKLAGDFQESTTQLVHGAGESEEKIAEIREGLLKLAPAVGMGPDKLAKAMFLVESAGFHGADGLKVMQSAAEAAKVGGADATVVANALTTAMVDYKVPASQAADITSKLVATVATGKTNMTDLAGSLSAVAPAAAAAHISLDEVLGSMGTMTGEGISAQQAAQDLSSTIASMSNPTAEQTKAMAQMGLSSIDVAKNLGKKGLTGTMSDLSEAVLKHMGPSGLVLEDAFNKSKLAAASAEEMLSKLPPSLQKLGQGYLDGTVTQKEWMKELRDQPALTASLGKQFATTAKEAHGFSDTLKAGGGSAKTFNAVMADMTGGTTGLNTALALTGSHAKTFQDNVKSISGATAEAGGHTKGWADTQKDFNVQMAQVGAQIQAVLIKVGDKLIPIVSQAIKVGAQWADSLDKNRPALIAIASVVGVVLVGAIGSWIAKLVVGAVESAVNFAKMIASAVAWTASTAVSIAETLALWAMYGAQWVAKTAISIAQNVALWAMYTGQWLAQQAKTFATFVAKNAVALASWVAGTGVQIAKNAALWLANAAKTVGALALQNAAMIAQKAVLVGGAVAMGIVTAAQWAWNVAMDANPLALILIAVVALVAGLVWFFTQTKLGKEIWKDVTDFFVSAFKATAQFLSDTWTNISKFFSDAIANIVAFVQQHWGLLLSFIIGPIGLAIQWVVENWGAIVKFFGDVIENVRKAIVKGFDAVMTWLGGLGKGFLKALGDVGSWLSDVGQHIVDGLWHGLQAAWNGMIGLFKGLINLLPDAVKNVLGIHSPSVVFRILGGFTGEGMALGLEDKKDRVQKAADALVPKLPSIPAPTLDDGGVAGALASSAGARGDGLTLNYTQNGGQGLTAEQELQRAARRLKQSIRKR